MDAYIEIVKMYNDFLYFALVKVVDKKFVGNLSNIWFLLLVILLILKLKRPLICEIFSLWWNSFIISNIPLKIFFFGLLTAFQYANLTPHKTGSYCGKFYAKCCGQTFFRRICLYDLALFLFPYHAYFLTRRFAQP